MASSSKQQQHEHRLSDEALFSQRRYLPYKQCNFCINYSKLNAHHEVMIEILKGHPLSYALSATTTVPNVYIQEFWNSLEYKPTTNANPEMCEGHIDNIKVQITQDFLRNVLRLPQKKDRKGMADFEKLPKKGVIIRDVRELGFDESDFEFTSSSKFAKKNFAALWSTLLMPINRCLTPKTSSQDKCSIKVLKIFHGLVYDKHYDFSLMIWTQFIDAVQNKSVYDYVPYVRFLKLFIAEFMRKDPSITTRSHAGCPVDWKMQRMGETCGNTKVKAMRIPEALLAYADPESSAVVDYRLKNPTVPAASLEPAPQGRIESEGAGESEHEERVVKKRASKKRKHPSTTKSSSRVTKKRKDPPSENTPVLVDNIEKDSSSLLERAHTPPSHLSSSQKDLISHTPQENPHELSSTLLLSMIDHRSEKICPHISLPPPHSPDNLTDHVDYTDNHMDHTDYTEIPFSGALSGISIPGIATTTPILSPPSLSDNTDNSPATRGSVKSCIQELTNRVVLLESENYKLEQQKNIAEAEVAFLTTQPSYPNVTQLVELLVTSLKPELSRLLSSHDFSSRIPSELKELPSKINELTGEIRELKKHVHELEIELPWGDPEEIPNKLETFASEVAQLKTLRCELPSEFLDLPGQVASVQAKLKTLDALPCLLNKVTDTFAHIMENASQKAVAGEKKNTNQATISQLFQSRIAKDAERTNLNPQPTTTITPFIPFSGVLMDQKLMQMGGQELRAHIVYLMRRKFNAKKV